MRTTTRPVSSVPHRPARPAAARVAALGVLASLAACAGAIHVINAPDATAQLSQLWVEPSDLERRDLYFGAGGKALAPDAGPYELVEEDATGASRGYDVLDRQGREWSVKFGIEAQPEVVVSRVLWAIGYHQDPVYYVDTWRFDDERGEQPAGRFRLEPEALEVVGEWSWRQNPFVGSRALAGLLITNVLLNNWDWKTSNNKIYGTEGPDGSSRAERYVVRDLGSALGRTTYPAWLQWSRLRGVLQGTKNDLDGFESQGFIRGVGGNRVFFDYVGIHGDLLDSVTTRDVVWTSRLLSRLSERQWQDAFRSAGYSPEIADRYVRHIQKKLADGLALEGSREPGLPE